MKWRNSKERELLSSGGSRESTLPNKSNPNPDLSDVSDDQKEAGEEGEFGSESARRGDSPNPEVAPAQCESMVDGVPEIPETTGAESDSEEEISVS